MTTVRLTQIDGKLPNLALMKLGAWHKARGDEVHFTRRVSRDLTEPAYDRVYASAIFKFSAARLDRLRWHWPDAIVGGTGTASKLTVEEITGPFEGYDYSLYPDYAPSVGFLTRGCRMACQFCVVPEKEGRPRPASTVGRLWRGPGHPKKLHLLDNDAFASKPHGMMDFWRQAIADIREGGFKVCFNQGINVRLITDEAAELLASIEYRDDSFSRRRVYTAWDDEDDKRLFFRGIDRLERAGIPPSRVMTYMLIGFNPAETEAARLERFSAMTERGILPYPMPFIRTRELVAFQRWAVTGLYRAVPWADYRHNARRADLPTRVAGPPPHRFDS